MNWKRAASQVEARSKHLDWHYSGFTKFCRNCIGIVQQLSLYFFKSSNEAPNLKIVWADQGYRIKLEKPVAMSKWMEINYSELKKDLKFCPDVGWYKGLLLG
ncbi:hypothetical protein D5R40_09935 [Okeania hirsuta]|uniref:Uncharacterized protein n=1 Tax=Okeania hirsuta TaxID=1458930 RepID=A0A3N6NLG6_9CYAN|nr:hypothetical protein D4Z78_19955 [Okeania hirsuta]RQH46203.1 hypothetical protein D5R40_09935 [Okeania hirsuta]